MAGLASAETSTNVPTYVEINLDVWALVHMDYANPDLHFCVKPKGGMLRCLQFQMMSSDGVPLLTETVGKVIEVEES